MIKHRPQKDVAKDHKVSSYLVSALCKKAENNKGFLKELVAKRDSTLVRRQAISDTILEMQELNIHIDSVKSV